MLMNGADDADVGERSTIVVERGPQVSGVVALTTRNWRSSSI
jgi:hypothetical protein